MRGITVTLYERTEGPADEFNRPTWTETATTVENVLVAPLSDDEIIQTLNLTGRRARYQLGIPKGDAHVWENCRVEFFGEVWRVIGHPTEGIEELIPLSWNKKVKVESITPTPEPSEPAPAQPETPIDDDEIPPWFDG